MIEIETVSVPQHFHTTTNNIKVIHNKQKTRCGIKTFLSEMLSIKFVNYPLLMGLCVYLEHLCPMAFKKLTEDYDQASQDDQIHDTLIQNICKFLCGSVPPEHAEGDYLPFVQLMKAAADKKGFEFDEQDFLC